MSTELILKELKDQAARLSNIETAMVTIARQDEKIVTIQKQIGILFQNYELAFNPKDGVVTEMKVFQEQCPKKNLQSSLTLFKWMIGGQWAVISLMVVILGGKVTGVF